MSTTDLTAYREEKRKKAESDQQRQDSVASFNSILDQVKDDLFSGKLTNVFVITIAPSDTKDDLDTCIYYGFRVNVQQVKEIMSQIPSS